MSKTYTVDERIEIFERYLHCKENNIPITEELEEEFKNASNQTKKYTDTLVDSLKQLGRSALQFGGEMSRGGEGAGKFTGLMTASTDAISENLQNFGQIGKVVAGLVDTASEIFGKGILDQADILYKAASDLSKTGAIGGRGMSETFEQMQKFGYTIGEIDNMVKLLNENSTALGAFGNTVSDGVNRISDLSESLSTSPVLGQLMDMGMTLDDVNHDLIAYVKQQTATGQARLMTTAQLRDGAINYMHNMDTLSRVTGFNRKQLEDQRERAQKIDAFMATTTVMDQNLAGSGQKMYDLFSMLEQIDPDLATAFAEDSTGVTTGSKESKKAWQLTHGQNLIWIRQFEEGNMSAPEVARNYLQAINAVSPELLNDATHGTRITESLVSAQTLIKARGMSVNDTTITYNAAYAATQAAAQVPDMATHDQTELRLAQRRASTGMNTWMHNGIVPMLDQLEHLVDKLDWMPGLGKRLLARTQGGQEAPQAEQIKPSPSFSAQAPGLMAKLESDFGLTPQQAAAIVGNLAHESAGLQAGIQERNPVGGGLGGLGWAQWTGPRRRAFEEYLARTGQRADDPDANYGFLKQELSSNYAKSIEAVKAAGNDTTAATIAFEQSYEGAGIKNYGSRLGYANEALKLSGATQTTAQTTTASAKQQYKMGGIAQGPTSGYQATLHGTEAIVPLPNGESIPVEMSNSSDQLTEQIKMILDQDIGRIDELSLLVSKRLKLSNKTAQRLPH